MDGGAGGGGVGVKINPFIVGLLLMNLGASFWFFGKGEYPWALIYFGASLIQTGCLWVSK